MNEELCTWEFYRKNNSKPIVNVKGSSDDLREESILLLLSCDIIHIAISRFDAKVYSGQNEQLKGTEKIVVSFSLIFSTEEKLNEFIKFIDQL